MPPPALLGAYLEVDEARFGLQEIRYLYENAGLSTAPSRHGGGGQS